MRKLDKYLVKQFLQSIFFGLITFTLIFIIIDLFENLDDFIDENVPFNMVVSFYLYFIPEIMRLMIPVATLLASLFVVGKLSNFNEMTIIKSSGISLSRFMAPFIVIAIFISIFSIVFGGWIVPYSNRQKNSIERNLLKRDIFHIGNNLFFQDSKDRIINITYFDDISNTANKTGIQIFDPNNNTKLIRRYDMDKLVYREDKNIWLGVNVIRRKFDTDSTELIEKKDTMVFANLNFKPRDLTYKLRKIEEFTMNNLFEIIDEQKKSGNDVTRLLIDVHTIFSFSFASLIVVFFGLPLMVDKRRGGVAIQFGMNIFITFIYLAFQQIVKAFGKNGSLDPFLTAWLPNFVFLFLAIINLIRVKK